MSVCLFSYIIHITRSFTANGGQSDCTKRKISKLSSVLFSFFLSFKLFHLNFTWFVWWIYVSVCIFSFNKITFRKVRFICCFCYSVLFKMLYQQWHKIWRSRMGGGNCPGSKSFRRERILLLKIVLVYKSYSSNH